MKKILYLWYLVLGTIASGQTKISELPSLPGSAATTTDALPIVDVSAGAEGSKKITLAELFSTPVPWQGPVVAGQYGGTGVNNSGKTITLGGNLTTSGANPLSLTTTGATNVTLPTSGTLATTTGANVSAAAFRATLGLPIRVTDYGAVGDGMMLNDAVIVSADNTLTCSSAAFPIDVAGKYVRVAGGVAAGTLQVETATAAGTIATSGTVSVIVTGSGIAGSPLSLSVNVAAGDTASVWAGKVRNYLSGTLQLFDRYYAGGSSSSISLTSNRPRDNDPDLNIALSNGTCTGVVAAATSTSTTSGAATVDLITSVVARNSGTSIELGTAPSRSASDVTVYYGTNDTAAIETAQLAAESAGVREVLFPEPAAGGCYLCNIVGRAHIALVGADGGLTGFEFDVGGPLPELSNRELLPTVLLPAVASEPVIGYSTATKVYGAAVKRLAIFGSKEQVGYGIQLGEPDMSASGFTGGGFVLDQVLISGFEYAFSSSRVAQMQANSCLFLYSRCCVYLGELSLGIGPTDTSVFNSCGTGGANCDANWFINASKGITINGGDHNDGSHVMIACNGSTVVANGLNSESVTNSPFVLATAKLTLNSSKVLHLNGPLVDAIGAGNDVSVSDADIGSATSGAQWEGVNIACRTDRADFVPGRLPRGMVVARYQDFGWSTLMQAEHTSRLYETAEAVRRQPRVADEFVKFSVAGDGKVLGTVMNSSDVDSQKVVYGELGWELTNLGGDAPTVYGLSQPASPGNSFGVFGVGTSTNNAANILRFGLPDEVLNATAQYWEMRWVISFDHSGGKIKFRCGAYSINGAFEPSNGIGIRVDRSVPESNIQFEVINASAVSSVDTGIPYTALTSPQEILITRTPQGYFFKMRAAPNFGQGMSYPQVKHTANVATSFGDYVTPCFIMGAAAASWPNVKPDRFLLEMFDAF